jgi:hypothetical protein
MVNNRETSGQFIQMPSSPRVMKKDLLTATLVPFTKVFNVITAQDLHKLGIQLHSIDQYFSNKVL